MAETPKRAGNKDAALPYYRWHVQAYRGSFAVQQLSHVERGLLRELLDECWDKGSIPDDPDRLAFHARCPAEVMRAAWPNLRPLFVEVPGSDGSLLTSRRLETERSIDDHERVKKVTAGRLGGLAKASNARKGSSTATDDPSTALASREVVEDDKRSSSALGEAAPLGGASPSLNNWLDEAQRLAESGAPLKRLTSE